MNHLFFDSIWPGLAVWVGLYVSDYTLTLKCARLYQRGVKEKIAFEGSYEITPYYQKDIDSLRVISPRFVVAMAAVCGYIAAIWLLAGVTETRLYQFVLGAMVLSQLSIHVRHIRNLFLFRAILGAEGIQGRIQYARPAMLRMSAVELFAVAGLYAFVFAFTLSPFVLGGVFSCVGIGLKHRALARKHVPVNDAAIQVSPQLPASETASH